MSRFSRIGVPTVLLLVAVSLAACDTDLNISTGRTEVKGSGAIASETLALEEFDSVLLLGEGHVAISIGPQASAAITADDNLLQYLDARVEGDTLLLEVADPDVDIDPTTTVEWEIVVPELRSVGLAGAGDIMVPPITSDDFQVDLTGAGTVFLPYLDVVDLSVRIAGAGTVTADGRAVNQEIAIPGAGDFMGYGLDSRDADVTLTGTGDATVSVSHHLDVTLTGVGSVFYRGDPEVDSMVSGIGEVTGIR
jgi:hypothetical protein